MEKKHLIIIVVAILSVALLLGLILNRCAGEDPVGGTEAPTGQTQPTNSATQPTGGTTEPTQPGGTDAPTQPTQSTVGTDPTHPTSGQENTQPTQPTQPTEPDHVHSFVKGETLAPTLDNSGYTLYTCESCGFRYEGDIVAALTLQQYINAQPLNPTATGVKVLDDLVQSILSQITKPEDTTYDKLQAIYDYQLTNFSHETTPVDVAQAFAFADGKVFRNVGELLISYEAYQILSGNGGVSDHYAAAFAVLTRAIGLESYVVNGTLGGGNHVWNNVRINGQLYVFDAYTATAPQYAKTDDELTGYTYRNREDYFARQTGFQSADAFTVTLTITDDSGTKDHVFTWDPALVTPGVETAMRNIITVEAEGFVEYTLTVTSGSGSFVLVDEYEIEEDGVQVGGSISSMLDPGMGGYTIGAEESDSLMYFEIRIENP